MLVDVEMKYLNQMGIKAKEIQQQTRINGLYSAYLLIYSRYEYPNEIGITTPIGGSLLDCEVEFC